jgi:heme oxygenase
MQPSATENTAEQTTLMDRLKAETAHAHAETEAIPFNAGIMAKTMPQARYAGQLFCWCRVHEVLESALNASTDSVVQGAWVGTTERAPLLAADLQWHVEADVPPEALQATTDMAEWVQAVGSDDPRCLLGMLYVLEGSTLGGMILGKCIAEMYGCEGDAGLAYYSAHGNKVMPNWMEFKARMNASVTSPEDQDRIVAAAVETFRRLGLILTGLSLGLPGSDD